MGKKIIKILHIKISLSGPMPDSNIENKWSEMQALMKLCNIPYTWSKSDKKEESYSNPKIKKNLTRGRHFEHVITCCKVWKPNIIHNFIYCIYTDPHFERKLFQEYRSIVLIKNEVLPNLLYRSEAMADIQLIRMWLKGNDLLIKFYFHFHK